jgi:small subunit ribosomal protein S9
MSEDQPQGEEQTPPQAEQEAPQASEPEQAPSEPQAPQASQPEQAPSEQQTTEAVAPSEPEAAQASEALAPVAAQASEPAAEPEAVEAQAQEEDEEELAPRVKPEVPGMHLEVDIVPEGVDPLGRAEQLDPYATDPYAVDEEDEAEPEAIEEDRAPEPISSVAIDLAAGARYIATGKRKTAIARVILRPGTGAYLINGRSLDEHFPRATLQRNIRQPLETVGYHERMDVVARLHGGGISAQAGALRHGVSKALLEADPNLRGELKRRGFLTRDARVKERKKAGLKKARKRPQFSKR